MPDFSLEKPYWEQGFQRIAGVDEAGRGPLAGPVIAAAVILPRDIQLPGLNDSKKLSAKKREALYTMITQHPAIEWAIGVASGEEIDEINILNATHLAMKRALDQLKPPLNFTLIDGLPIKQFPYDHQGVVKGDSLSLSIAAASILAKVTRDQLMLALDQEFPHYGFARHQGYGTKIHLDALRVHGPCQHHRRSFKPVAQYLVD